MFASAVNVDNKQLITIITTEQRYNRRRTGAGKNLLRRREMDESLDLP